MRAQDLRVGVRAQFFIDPHYIFDLPNMAASRYLYDTLADRDADGRPQPGIATSWTLLDDHTWEFRLRPGVKFHDGSPLTAEDVAFSIERIPNVPTNPNPYTANLRNITSVEVVDPLTIRLHTDRPNAVIPGQMTNVFIVSHIRAAGALPPDFASGKAAVGTGPYKLVSYTYGEAMELERNDEYYGRKPYWRRIRIRVIPSNSARIAALLAGDVDLIDQIPPSNVKALEANPAVRVYKKISDRVVYLQLDQREAVPAQVTDGTGHPLSVNPFRDARVRQAISKAINRPALVDAALEGQGAPIGQLVPEGFGAYNPALAAPPYQAGASRALIAAAGLEHGLAMTVTCTNDRLMSDTEVCQAIGQMLTRAGISTKVETVPGATFYQKLTRNEIPVVLYSSSTSSTRDATHTLALALHSVDQKQGFGLANRGGFKDPELDRMIEDAVYSTGPEREKKLMAAMAKAMEMAVVIPLYDEMTILAGRRNLIYDPRVDEQTVATSTLPVP